MGRKAHQCIRSGYVSVTRPIKSEIAELGKNELVIDELSRLWMSLSALIDELTGM